MKYVLSFVAFAFCSNVCANAQTIADIARQERAKRQASQKGPVITNATLPEGIPPSPPIAPAAPVTSPATATTDKEKESGVRDEKWWRGEFQKARAEVGKSENRVTVAELALNSANRDFLTRAYDPDGRGPKAISKATTELNDAKKQLEKDRAKVSQLEEDLRRAGAPAGWAR